MKGRIFYILIICLVLVTSLSASAADKHVYLWNTIDWRLTPLDQRSSTIPGIDHVGDVSGRGEQYFYLGAFSFVYSLDLKNGSSHPRFDPADLGIPGFDRPKTIAFDGNSLFLAQGQKIVRTTPNGTEATLLAELLDGYISDMVVADALYIADEERGIYAIDLVTGVETLLAEKQGSPLAITFYGDTLYYSDDITNQILSVPMAGGDVKEVIDMDDQLGAGNKVVNALSIAAGRIWIGASWNAGNACMSCRLDGTGARVTTIFGGNASSPATLRYDPGSAMWVLPNTETGESQLEPLRMSAPLIIEEDLEFYWTAVTGNQYRLRYAPDLFDLENASVLQEAGDGLYRHSGVLATSKQGFYWVERVAP